MSRIVDALNRSLDKTKRDYGTAQVVDCTLLAPAARAASTHPAIEVTHETAQDAALRFRGSRVTVLNFASANHPGGGVRKGAKAQEEALCACSGLLHGLESCMALYQANNAPNAPKEGYDRMIYSEDVPLVLDGKLQPVPTMRINVITYSAPNCLRKQFTRKEAQDIFERRIRHVLLQADHCNSEVLILGAWGCGAYGNDPNIVAAAFKEALAEGCNTTSKLVFAIYGNAENQQVFGSAFA